MPQDLRRHESVDLLLLIDGNPQTPHKQAEFKQPRSLQGGQISRKLDLKSRPIENDSNEEDLQMKGKGPETEQASSFSQLLSIKVNSWEPVILRSSTATEIWHCPQTARHPTVSLHSSLLLYMQRRCRNFSRTYEWVSLSATIDFHKPALLRSTVVQPTPTYKHTHTHTRTVWRGVKCKAPYNPSNRAQSNIRSSFVVLTRCLNAESNAKA